MDEEDRRYLCTHCYGGHVEYRRWKMGYTTCLACGNEANKLKELPNETADRHLVDVCSRPVIRSPSP